MRTFVAAVFVAWCAMGAAAEVPPITDKGESGPPVERAETVPDETPEKLPPPPPRKITPGESCPPGGPPIVTRMVRGDETALRYCGLINAQGVDAFEAALTENERVLVITSFGGELDAPLRLAELVAARGMDVEVAGPCFSGCASFVFVAGKRRVVTGTGILGFHNTASSSTLLGLRSLNGGPPSGFGPVLDRVSREWRLYATQGAAFSLLYEPQVRIQTICTRPRGLHPVSGEQVIDIHSANDFWLPAPGALGEAGIEFEGSLPSSERDAARRFHLYMPTEIPAPKFSSENRKLSKPAEILLYDIPGCPEPAAPPNPKPVRTEAPAQPAVQPESRKLRPRDSGPDQDG